MSHDPLTTTDSFLTSTANALCSECTGNRITSCMSLPGGIPSALRPVRRRDSERRRAYTLCVCVQVYVCMFVCLFVCVCVQVYVCVCV